MKDRTKDYKRLADLSFESLSTGGIFAILFAIVNFIWQVYKFLKSIYNFFRPFVDSIVSWCYKYVIPWINFLNFWITTLKNFLLVIQGKLLQVIEDVYKKVFPGLEDLRNGIVSVFNTLKDIVSVFSEGLARQIGTVEDSLLRIIDKYTRDVRGELIGYVHQYSDPIIQKINGVLILLNEARDWLNKRVSQLENLIATTFEKPQTLKREVLFTTSMHWGVGLWNDLFAGITPTTPVTPSAEAMQLQVDPLIDKYIEDIFAEKVEGWQDVSQRVDEEIREKFYGEVIPSKTKITIPELRAKIKGEF